MELLGVFVTNPRGRSLVDVLLSKQPSVNETSRSTGAVNIQSHVPDPTRAQIASVGVGVTTAARLRLKKKNECSSKNVILRDRSQFKVCVFLFFFGYYMYPFIYNTLRKKENNAEINEYSNVASYIVKSLECKPWSELNIFKWCQKFKPSFGT